MSRYSERHTSTAPCHYDLCDEPGTRLAMIGGRPHWLCEWHFEEREKRNAS